MAVDDLWISKRTGERTPRHGIGKRYRVRVKGHPSRSFALLKPAQAWERKLLTEVPRRHVDVTVEQLRADFDAVVLSVGSTIGRDLQIPGRELDGIHQAMEFLPQANRVQHGDTVEGQIVATGKKVVIIGGGDTGADCLGTSIRQEAASVTQLEIMPKPPVRLSVPALPCSVSSPVVPRPVSCGRRPMTSLSPALVAKSVLLMRSEFAPLPMKDQT